MLGVTRGTTRGAKKDYVLGPCFQPNGTKPPAGAEVAFRFVPPLNSTLKISVRSLTEGFVPAFYIAESAAACKDTILRGLCSTSPTTQVYLQAPELAILVGSTNSVEGDFELVLEASPLGGAGGGSASSGGGAGGGSTSNGGGGGGIGGGQGGGNSAGGAVTAEAVWKTQSDVRTVADDARTFYLSRLKNWTRTAQQAAGSQASIITGTITETAANQFAYSAVPTDRLEIVRLTGLRFSFTISSLTGALTSTTFPTANEAVSFSWRLSGAVVSGTIAYRATSLTGRGYLKESDNDLSTFNLSSSTIGNSFTDVANARTYLDTQVSISGTIQAPSRNISFTVSASINGCVGTSCVPAIVLASRSHDVTTTVAGTTYRLEYDYNTSTPSIGLQNVAFNGVVWSGGQQVGSLQRTNISGYSYSLDLVLGQSRFITEVVQSTP